jgi:arsenate reductase
MSDPIKVLFVCVHNAARSRIAEAYLKKLGGSEFEVTSSGFEPQEANPLVVEAMKLVGMPLLATGKQPSVFDLFRSGRLFNYVIAVCDEANSQKCPIFPGMTTRVSWSFPDPSEFTGSYGEKLAQVIAIRDAIRARIELWLKEIPH